MLFAALLLLLGFSAITVALAASPRRLAPGGLAGTEARFCGPCGTPTTHLVDTAGVGCCTTCGAENPRYTAAA